MKRLLVGGEANKIFLRSERWKNDPLPQKRIRNAQNIRTVQVRHVLGAENSQTDALEKLATASQEDLDRLILVEHLPEPSININNEEIFPMMTASSWMDPI